MKLLKVLIILLGAAAIIHGLLIVYAANWADTPNKYQEILNRGLEYIILGTATVFSGTILKSSMPRILFTTTSSIALVTFPFIFERANFSDQIVVYGIPLMIEVVILFLLNDLRKLVKR